MESEDNLLGLGLEARVGWGGDLDHGGGGGVGGECVRSICFFDLAWRDRGAISLAGLFPLSFQRVQGSPVLQHHCMRPECCRLLWSRFAGHS